MQQIEETMEGPAGGIENLKNLTCPRIDVDREVRRVLARYAQDRRQVFSCERQSSPTIRSDTPPDGEREIPTDHRPDRRQHDLVRERFPCLDRKSTRLNSSHTHQSRMPTSA